MKSFHAIVLALLSFCLGQPAMADTPCQHLLTQLKCGSGRIEAINQVGQVKLVGTTVKTHALILGQFSAAKAILNTLNVTGKVTMTNTHVRGHANITGLSNIVHSQFDNTLNLVGNLIANNDTFKGDVRVIGLLNAADSRFDKKLTITSKRITLSHVKAHSILINKHSEKLVPQVLVLQKGTSVKGDIRFVQGNGLVIVSNDSKVEGQIIGADVQHKRI